MTTDILHGRIDIGEHKMSGTDDLPSYSDMLTLIQRFLFGSPLYKEIEFNEQALRLVFRNREARIDAWCPYCHKEAVFVVAGDYMNDTAWSNVQTLTMFRDTKAHCTRVDTHTIYFNCLLKRMILQKVGQYPSFATIAQDETAKYRKTLSGEDANEFYKAIGLAAHGVGVGSFVYLRRVFERLIMGRFNQFCAQEGWDGTTFARMRMEEKVELLRGHLPEFLVRNRRIYSILSIGLHELQEQTCLDFFDIMKDSIVTILEDDKKKQEELALRQHMEKAIAAFQQETKEPLSGTVADT